MLLIKYTIQQSSYKASDFILKNERNTYHDSQYDDNLNGV